MDWKKCKKEVHGDAIPAEWLFPHYYDALNTLFRIENALRMLVYVVLKSELREKWVDQQVSSDESSDTTVAALAKRRIAQHQTYGYLGHAVEAPIMQLTSGELVRLLCSDQNWPRFKDYFLASRQVVTLKLLEIGDVRNALAHFRPVAEDDVEAVKQNAKQVLSSVEEALASMFACSQRVPTNTEDQWYREIRTLGTDLCALHFSQSTDGRWVRVSVRVAARPLGQSRQVIGKRMFYDVLNIDSGEVLRKHDDLRSLVVFLTERIPHVSMPQDLKPNISKRLDFTFGRSTLAEEFERVCEGLKSLLLTVDEEAELMAADNLARGKLLDLVRVWANQIGEGTSLSWWFNTNAMSCPLRTSHPPEYWGDLEMPRSDLLSSTIQFPWMPTAISKYEDTPF